VKRFEFSLDRLLKVKRQLERMVEMEQSRAAQAVAEARGTVDGLNRRLDQVAASIQSSVVRGALSDLWTSAYSMSEQLGAELDRAEQAVRLAEERLADAARRRTAAATEVEVLASLRGRKWDEWKQENAVKTQEQLDETTMRRWMDARAGTERTV
jgi:flagellar protein FliJ